MTRFGMFLLTWLPAVCLATSVADWQQLIRSQKFDEARTLCTPAMNDKDPAVATEAYKCMSNLALVGGDVITIDPGENGVTPLGSGFNPKAADASLAYLEKGLDLSPNDLSIHLGRLYVLMQSLRYEQMAGALKNSLDRYHGKDAYGDWLGFAHKLSNRGKYTTAIEYLKVLDTRYPNDKQIIGNIGAYYLMLNQHDEARTYLKRAVELGPNDSINNWDLALEYEDAGDYNSADIYFQSALKHDEMHDGGDPLSKEDECVYRKFVYEKLQDEKKACDIPPGACASQKLECPTQ